MKRLPVALLACALSAPSFAADTPNNPCSRPIVPGKNVSDTVLTMFNKRAETYKKCMTKFVDEQREIAKQVADRARSDAAYEAAEAAVKEYNAFIEELTARNPAEDD